MEWRTAHLAAAPNDGPAEMEFVQELAAELQAIAQKQDKPATSMLLTLMKPRQPFLQ
jgi:hypothetical protein